MTQMGDSTLFSFDGRHCTDFGVAFMPEGYPLVPEQDVPSMRIAGRHGTLRWKGRTFAPRELRGRLYLLGAGDGAEPIATGEMLRRASEVAAWLCGRDGRGRLILDAVPERYYVAEVTGEATLSDRDWANGCARIAFICQPFARSVTESTASGEAAAGESASVRLIVEGNAQTELAFDIEAVDAVQTAEVAAGGTRMAFEGLNMAAGESLSATYTEDGLLALGIRGADGAVRSAMMARTADSDDDVTLMPGANEIAMRADGAVRITARARGRWL